MRIELHSRFVTRIEVKLLVLWVGLAALTWSFLSLASELREGELTAFDRRVLLALRLPGKPHMPLGPMWLTECMRDLTALGGFTLLLIFTTFAGILLLVHSRRLQAAALAAAVLLAQLSSDVFKVFYARTRPHFAIYGDLPLSQSFPSGHSTVATATYFLVAVVVSTVETNRSAKVCAFLFAALLSIAVWCSRVYLGVHWPSDVLAGWLLGGTWALITSLVLHSVSARQRSHG